jgi:hypothetical protein
MQLVLPKGKSERLLRIPFLFTPLFACSFLKHKKIWNEYHHQPAIQRHTGSMLTAAIGYTGIEHSAWRIGRCR